MGNRTEPTPKEIVRQFALDSVLDQFRVPIKNQGLQVAQNIVYRRVGSYAKRPGSSVYGSGASTGMTLPVISGYRWSRGINNAVPAILRQMVVQSGDALWTGNDATGAFTSIGALTAGSSPAYFAGAFDPTNTGGNPNSDILICAYGSGAPKKWDGTTLSALSAGITNPFTGCVNWHEHVFLWGDPSFPDQVFATDLGNPESYANSSAYGGYKIGRGDGDALVTRCIDVGPTLWCFKNRSIQVMTGYDFAASSDQQFQLGPFVSGIGTPAPGLSVAKLRTSVVWWSGQNFYRMTLGDTEPTVIGNPIVNLIAQAAQNNQSVIRGVAGDFLVQGINGPTVLNNVYIVAIDGGSGVANTVLVYDENITAEVGKPAWSVWTGLNIGCFIPWGGPNDQKLLYAGDGVIGDVHLIGGDPTADVKRDGTRVVIPVQWTTGRNDGGSPDRLKKMSRLYIDAETTAVTFDVTVTSDVTGSVTNSTAQGGAMGAGGVFGTATFGGAAFGSSSKTTYVSDEIPLANIMDGHNFQVSVYEASSSSAYEVVALSYRAIEEAYHL